MADAGGQQVAAAEDNSDMATEEPQQESRLLSIAPEMRNAIYELSMPKSTALVRVERIGPKLSYQQQLMYPSGIAPGMILRFHLGLPPLYYVCRSTHKDFPLLEFYASSTFIFTDSIMQPAVLDAFMSTCAEAVTAMKSIKVSIASRSDLTLSLTQGAFDVKFRINKCENGEVKVGQLRTIPKASSEYYGDDLCLCKLLRLARLGTQHDYSPVEVLREFLALCRASVQGEWRTFLAHNGNHGHWCEGCGSPELRGAQPGAQPRRPRLVLDEASAR
ncbi:hypothetical protein LTR10_004288 [Elasticomyces elasticus]|nr:hypothetical protein LTR10_004288 [Elasticomyces elasticus]KAK4977533.1 hypothetical protein LTR42_001903 [Elasticomyces elasticus]